MLGYLPKFDNWRFVRQEIRYLALYEVQGKKPHRLREYKRYDISTLRNY